MAHCKYKYVRGADSPNHVESAYIFSHTNEMHFLYEGIPISFETHETYLLITYKANETNKNAVNI